MTSETSKAEVSRRRLRGVRECAKRGAPGECRCGGVMGAAFLVHPGPNFLNMSACSTNWHHRNVEISIPIACITDRKSEALNLGVEPQTTKKSFEPKSSTRVNESGLQRQPLCLAQRQAQSLGHDWLGARESRRGKNLLQDAGKQQRDDLASLHRQRCRTQCHAKVLEAARGISAEPKLPTGPQHGKHS